MPPVIKTNPKDIADRAGLNSLLLFADPGIKSFQKKWETKKLYSINLCESSMLYAPKKLHSAGCFWVVFDAQVLAYFDSEPFRAMLKDCCPSIANVHSEDGPGSVDNGRWCFRKFGRNMKIKDPRTGLPFKTTY